jgi:hypothetical protein
MTLYFRIKSKDFLYAVSDVKIKYIVKICNCSYSTLYRLRCRLGLPGAWPYYSLRNNAVIDTVSDFRLEYITKCNDYERKLLEDVLYLKEHGVLPKLSKPLSNKRRTPTYAKKVDCPPPRVVLAPREKIAQPEQPEQQPEELAQPEETDIESILLEGMSPSGDLADYEWMTNIEQTTNRY